MFFLIMVIVIVAPINNTIGAILLLEHFDLIPPCETPDENE